MKRGRTAAEAADRIPFWESVAGHPYALPDAIAIDEASVHAVRAAATDAWRIYARVAALLRALPDGGLAALGIPAAAYEVVRLHDERAGPTLVGRFDFIFDGERHRVVELNAETPFFIVESFEENGRRARAAGLRDPNAGERERLGEAIACALRPLAAPARVGVVALNVYREDAGTAVWLRNLIAQRTDAEVVFVPAHELRVAGGEVHDAGGRLDVLYRCYPTEHFAADRGGRAFFDAVLAGAVRLLNPPSALLLQSKAAQALIWGLYERGEFFDDDERAAIARVILPTYLDPPEDGAPYVRKPVLGREGIGVEILGADGVRVARGESAPPAYASQPHVYQRFVRAPRRRVRTGTSTVVEGEELTTCFLVGGEPSAVGLRIGGPVTDAWSYFAPIGVR